MTSTAPARAFACVAYLSLVGLTAMAVSAWVLSRGSVAGVPAPVIWLSVLAMVAALSGSVAVFGRGVAEPGTRS